MEQLTRHSQDRDGAQALFPEEPVELKLICPVGLQARYGDFPLVCSRGHCPGMPVCIGELDQEGVKGAAGNSPGEVQGVRGLACHCQIPQARRGWGLLLQGSCWGEGN